MLLALGKNVASSVLVLAAILIWKLFVVSQLLMYNQCNLPVHPVFRGIERELRSPHYNRRG